MGLLKSAPNVYICRDDSVYVDREGLKASLVKDAQTMLEKCPEAVLFHIAM